MINILNKDSSMYLNLFYICVTFKGIQVNCLCCKQSCALHLMPFFNSCPKQPCSSKNNPEVQVSKLFHSLSMVAVDF